MGDAGAASGEPLESYRATHESTGVPELSPLGRWVRPPSRPLPLSLVVLLVLVLERAWMPDLCISLHDFGSLRFRSFPYLTCLEHMTGGTSMGRGWTCLDLSGPAFGCFDINNGPCWKKIVFSESAAPTSFFLALRLALPCCLLCSICVYLCECVLFDRLVKSQSLCETRVQTERIFTPEHVTSRETLVTIG